MTVRLFHVSDLHFGRADQEALDWFSARVRDERPAAVIVTGDLTMRARAREYAAATEWLKGLAVPVSVEPGNHDLPYFNPIARLFHPYRRHGRVQASLERPLDLPGVWLVPLRTTARAQLRRNWSWGIVRRRALDGALTLLARKPGDHVAIVACHHPLVDRDGLEPAKGTRGGRAALKALGAAGADAVLSGHVHDPFDLALPVAGRTVRMIGAGTLSERTRTSPPSFNELIVEGGRLEVIERTMTAEPAQTLATDKGLLDA